MMAVTANAITLEEIQILEKAVGCKGKLIFSMVCGSSCYNLSTASSDRDLFGVYISHYEGPFVKVKEDFTSNDPDYCIYEISKYCSLLCKGNPKLIEPLYTTRFYHCTEEWKAIYPIAHTALNQTTVMQYKKYSKQQVHNFEEDKKQNVVNSKKLYHALRLAMEAHQITLKKPPRIWFEGEEREYLLKIRNNSIPIPEILDKIDQYQNLSSDLLGSLPVEVDTSLLAKEWLVPLKKAVLLKNPTPLMDINKLHQVVQDNPYFKSLAEAVLKEHNLNGYILFCAPYGSSASKGNFNGDEDIDLLCVFAAPSELMIDSLNPFPQILLPSNSKSAVTDKYRRGIQLVEVEHFFSNLLQGNHVMTESLFLPPTNLFVTEAWLPFLLNNPHNNQCPDFLSVGHVMHYVGNAETLLKRKYSSGEETTKYHQIAQKFVDQAMKISNKQLPECPYKLEKLRPVEELLKEAADLKKTKGGLEKKNDEARSFVNHYLITLRKALL